MNASVTMEIMPSSSTRDLFPYYSQHINNLLEHVMQCKLNCYKFLCEMVTLTTAHLTNFHIFTNTKKSNNTKLA